MYIFPLCDFLPRLKSKYFNGGGLLTKVGILGKIFSKNRKLKENGNVR
jgi:hypothetical protein